MFQIVSIGKVSGPEKKGENFSFLLNAEIILNFLFLARMVAFPWHSGRLFKYNPYIGPFPEANPPVIVGYIDSPMAALFAVITVVITQLIDNLYLTPFMISKKVDINPLLSVVLTFAASLLLGSPGCWALLVVGLSWLLGPPGIVFAIPIYSI
ncbi:AI-2E family transporter [Methanosarcina lacustris]|uniref:AI-2E family transporter n=1 Tax=Methanosarcina lacustris TaxID=170861 RepID=UPI00064EBCFC|nr:AI-2E family transporter [Methanosarcina lacustris]